MARTPVNTDLGNPEGVRTVARTAGIQAPVATINGNGMMALAESLRAVRPELTGYLEEMKAQYQEEEAGRAYDTIQGMTYDEAAAAVSSGAMRKTESPWFQAAFQKQFGLSHAAERKRQIITDYNNSFDKDNGDLGEFLRGYAQEDLEKFGDSEFIKSGMREGMAGVFDGVKNNHAEYKDTQTQARTGDQFFNVAGAAVDEAISSGGDVSASLSALYGDHKSALGMTPEQLDKQTLALAEKYAAEGNTKAVEAILSADPQGLGAFTARAGTASNSLALIESSKATEGKTGRTENTLPIVELKTRASNGQLSDEDKAAIDTLAEGKQLSQAERESLLEENGNMVESRVADAFTVNLQSQAATEAAAMVTTGQGALIQDRTVINPHDGSEIVFKAEELRDYVVTEKLDAIAEQGADLPNVTAVMGQQLASFAVSSTYAPWTNSLSDGHISLTNALRTQDEGGAVTIPEPAQRGYKLWKELAGTPAIRERHTTDPTAAAIYRDAETLESNGYMGPEDALIAAARAAEGRKDGRVALSTSLDRNKFAAAIKGSMSGGWFGFSAAPSNAGVAAMEIERQARLLIDLNIPMDKAIKTATERFQTSYTAVNGVYVNTRDRLIPQNFDEIVTANLEDFVAVNPDAADEDLTLWPSSDQDYWYVSDSLGIPIPGSKPLHISQLQKNPRAYSMADANKDVRANR